MKKSCKQSPSMKKGIAFLMVFALAGILAHNNLSEVSATKFELEESIGENATGLMEEVTQQESVAEESVMPERCEDAEVSEQPQSTEGTTLEMMQTTDGGMLQSVEITEEEVASADSVVDAVTLELTTAEADVQQLVYVEEEPQYIIETRYDKYIVVENGIEFHYVADDTWQGLMMIVKDPSRVFVGTCRDVYDGSTGLNSTRIAKRYGALLAINGAFFVDTNYVGNGGTPKGLVFSQGEQKYGGLDTVYNLIGFDQDNNCICGTMTGRKALELGVRDGVTCNPILVQNGEMNAGIKGQTFMDARSAIGVREDGAVLMLMVDGRMAHSIGASTPDLAECMLEFGAVNAGNLDGGGSVSIYYAGETPIQGLSSSFGSRAVPNAICVMPESEVE